MDPWDGVVEVVPDDDFDSRGNDLSFDVGNDYNKKSKKNKNKVIEIQYEGYALEKAQPLPGDKTSWARVGHRQLPFDDKALIDIAKKHRKQKGTSVEEDFKGLSANQQGVVTSLLESRQREERNKNAKWIPYDVQRIGKYKWRSVDVKQLQVIIKRVDRNIPTKNGEYVKSTSKDKDGYRDKNQYNDFEIIDLAEPTKFNSTGGKKKDKKVKKHRSADDLYDKNSMDDPLGGVMNMGSLGIVGGPPQHGHNNRNSQTHFDHQMPRDNRPQFDQILPPPPLHPPGGALPPTFPMEQNNHGQFHQQHLPQQPFHQQPFPNSARQSFSHDQNPFQPHPNVASPIQFDLPPMSEHQWPHPHHQNGRDLPRARSQSRERRMSARHTSVGADVNNMRRLENKIDDLTLSLKVQNWKQGSESSEYEEDSLFSYPQSDGHSFTPPSSPGNYFDHNKSRGSLERRRSSASRDPRYHPRYRSHRYRDAEIEPAYSYRNNDQRRYPPEYRRESKRPSLHHAHTIDDYPTGRGAEQRYLPPAPNPPPPRGLQRRLTEHGDRERWGNQDWDDRRQNDFRDTQDRRYGDNRYDGGRRESQFDNGRRESHFDNRRDSAFDGRRQSNYDSRRQNYAGGGGGDYYQ